MNEIQPPDYPGFQADRALNAISKTYFEGPKPENARLDVINYFNSKIDYVDSLNGQDPEFTEAEAKAGLYVLHHAAKGNWKPAIAELKKISDEMKGSADEQIEHDSIALANLAGSLTI